MQLITDALTAYHCNDYTIFKIRTIAVRSASCCPFKQSVWLWLDWWMCVFQSVLLCVMLQWGSSSAGSSSADPPVQPNSMHFLLTLWPAYTLKNPVKNTHRASMSTVSEPLVGSCRSLSAAKRHKSIRKNSRRIYSAYQDHQQGLVCSLFLFDQCYVYQDIWADTFFQHLCVSVCYSHTLWLSSFWASHYIL